MWHCCLPLNGWCVAVGGWLLGAVEIFELCFNKCGGGCCTYAPLNHEMQSNLRSSNGKYCVYPETSLLETPPSPAGHFKFGDRIGGGAVSGHQFASSSWQLSRTRPQNNWLELALLQLNFRCFGFQIFTNEWELTKGYAELLETGYLYI